MSLGQSGANFFCPARQFGLRAVSQREPLEACGDHRNPGTASPVWEDGLAEEAVNSAGGRLTVTEAKLSHPQRLSCELVGAAREEGE